jgi:hypothetical protein
MNDQDILDNAPSDCTSAIYNKYNGEWYYNVLTGQRLLSDIRKIVEQQARIAKLELAFAVIEGRKAELESLLVKIRDLLGEQEDKSCLGTGYPANAYECAPWPIVDEVIDSITQALKAKQ